MVVDLNINFRAEVLSLAQQIVMLSPLLEENEIEGLQKDMDATNRLYAGKLLNVSTRMKIQKCDKKVK